MSAEVIALPGLPPFPPELTDELWAAFLEQPKGYSPRTHHLRADGRPKYLNRLMTSSSPYLLQHAHNPVNWYPWSEEASSAARDADRPILLSVGYATCHWCHVMERESFEDEEIAAAMNRDFICIKVDREERPDVDSVYMTAVQLMSGGGGWPMTVVMTPAGEPFFAGTYFPARDGDRGARVGFLTLLERIADAWRTQRAQVDREAERLTRALQGANLPKAAEQLPAPRALAEASHFLARMFDESWGGFGGAPKFPRPSTYELLLRYAHRTGDPAALHMVVTSLEKMSAGGIYDHIGGGFARYSTDRQWLVPHFEKMLYDNAQLAALLTEAWQATRHAGFARTLRETLDYVLLEMADPTGGFYSATDADSEGVEGKFFTWALREIEEVLGAERAQRFAMVYGVTERGNFEGTNVLHLARSVEAVAEELGAPVEQLRAELDADRRALYRARLGRVRPLLDDKILTEWNAQMMGALARAGFALDEPRYLEAARRAAAFLLETLQLESGALARAYRHGRISGQAVLEDYAFTAAGLLDLFEATAERRWLTAARAIVDRMIDGFWDRDAGGFFATSSEERGLLVRDKPSYDGAQPSGNSVAALALLRLSALTTEPGYAELADRILLAFGQALESGAIQTPKLALALDWRWDRPKEVLVVLSPGDDGAALQAVLRRSFVPNAVRLVAREETLRGLQDLVPWVDGKVPREGRATAYVCLEGACKEPTSDPQVLARQLAPEVPLEAPPIRLGRGR